MTWLWRLWRNLTNSRRVDDDVCDELSASFDLLVDEKMSAGLSRDEARRAARLELGPISATADAIRDVRAGASLVVLHRDVRYALRCFRRSPGFVTVAILTLALGIGANAAIFSVVKSVLLDALPYREASHLMRLHLVSADGTQVDAAFRATTVREIVVRQRSFSQLAAFAPVRDGVYGADDARIVAIGWVEPRLFETLGVTAALGRTLDDDDRAVGYVPASGVESGIDTAPALLLSDAAWRRLFAADPSIIGRRIRINGQAREVVGVLPPDFIGPKGTADVYLAFDLSAAVQTGAGWLGIVGRLRPGVTTDDAARDVARIAGELKREHSAAAVGDRTAIAAIPLREAMVGNLRGALLVLAASAALVLLIACANLAGVLVSRSLSRRREFALRIALGANRGRLVRQLLTESAVLALLGGTAGLLLADGLLSVLEKVAPAALPAHVNLSLDTGVIGVTAVVSIVTGLAFGVVPALSVDRADNGVMLRGGARGASESRRPRRLRGGLVAIQLALCAALLVGAAVLSRSLWQMMTAPIGLDPVGVFSATLRLPTARYPTLESRSDFQQRLIERLRRLPGVESVALANKVPTISPRREAFLKEDAAPGTAQTVVLYAAVTDDYFRTLRIPVRRGRTFEGSDRQGSPPVVVISETMARRYWPAGDALGARIRLNDTVATIVGIVGDVRNDLAKFDADPMVYRSFRQESTWVVAILVRVQGEPLAVTQSVDREVAAIEPELPLQNTLALEEAVGGGLAARRLPVALLSGFGVLALLLSSLGVYALFASMAAAREREFGVRMALGSSACGVAALLMRQGAGWMALGLAGGAAGAWLQMRVLGSLISNVPPFDPVAAAIAATILLLAAALALVIPIRRATRVDPIIALRAE